MPLQVYNELQTYNDFCNENLAVARISELFALSLGHCTIHARQIGIAGLVHDIGKTLIDPAILYKPDKLTMEEFEIMKTHTKLGSQIVFSARHIPKEIKIIMANVCEFHHEWHNGGGYWGVPAGWLPGYVSIVAITDVYVACRSARAYKPSWPHEQTLAYLTSLAGTQFCSGIVDSFVRFAGNQENELMGVTAERRELESCEQKD